MKIHTQFLGNILVQTCQVVAKMAGKNVEVVVDSDETRAEKSYKTVNPTNKFPLLCTPEGKLSESSAIAKYLASGHATLLGANAVERAQIDQWMSWVGSGVSQQGSPAVYAILGRNTEVTQPAFNQSCQDIKANVRAVDSALTGDWLVGNSCTLADLYLAASFTLYFQLILDQGFAKAAPKACAWFSRVSSLPEFVAIFGKIRLAKKSIKPVLKVEEKKPKAAAAAAKPKTEDAPKKEVNPLEALPPTSFDLFNFKTYYVNAPDKAGEGFDKFLAECDWEGYTFWFLHYEKVGNEGTVEYQFVNLLEGFLQRLDNFRKHAFGKLCLLGAEPSMEMAGVLLIRGTIIPQECVDHPQFEYMRARKMDMKNAADADLARKFMSSKDDTTTPIMDLPVLCSMWHK